MLISELTPAAITAWLAALHVTPGTARKNLCALSSYVRYQRTIGALDRNPLELVTVPKKNPPRLRFESLETCQAIVDSQDEPYRAGGGAFASNTRRTATATTTSANSVFLTCNC